MQLYGLGLDAEDGRENLETAWSLSGPVTAGGTADLLKLGALVPGAYRANFTVTDQNGRSTSAVRRFEILPLTVPTVESAPLLDGLCNESVYGDATFFRVPYRPADGERPLPVRMVYADGFLHVSFSELAIARAARGVAPQAVGLRVDVDGDGSPLVEVGDIGFFVDQNGLLYEEMGTGEGMEITPSPVPGFEAVIKHGERAWCAEFRIAEHLIGGWNHAARISFQHGTSVWPPLAERDKAATWAPAYFGDDAPAENRAPYADGGEPQYINVAAPRTVILDGGNSGDPDGDAISYQWTQTGGPVVTLRGADTSSPKFEVNAVSSTRTLTFRLVVSDGERTSQPASTRVVLVPTRRFVPIEPEPPSAEGIRTEILLTNDGSVLARYSGLTPEFSTGWKPRWIS